MGLAMWYGVIAAGVSAALLSSWLGVSPTVSIAAFWIAAAVAWSGLRVLFSPDRRWSYALLFWSLAAETDNEYLAEMYRHVGNFCSPYFADDVSVLVPDDLGWLLGDDWLGDA